MKIKNRYPLKRRLAGKLHKHRELRREANDTKSTAQRAIVRNQRHEGQRYETDGSKGDGTKPTASYTRVVARAITCDWAVMELGSSTRVPSIRSRMRLTAVGAIQSRQESMVVSGGWK